VSFMPSPGSIVRGANWRIGIVTSVTPDGKGDMVVWLSDEYSDGRPDVSVSPDDIYEVIHEVEGDAR